MELSRSTFKRPARFSMDPNKIAEEATPEQNHGNQQVSKIPGCIDATYQEGWSKHSHDKTYTIKTSLLKITATCQWFCPTLGYRHRHLADDQRLRNTGAHSQQFTRLNQEQSTDPGPGKCRTRRGANAATAQSTLLPILMGQLLSKRRHIQL